MLTDLEKLNSFIKERNEFSNKTFGSPKVRSCIAPLKHLQEEVQELIDNPNDPMEWADCFLLLLDASWRKGYSVDDLIDFAKQKLEINKKRTWKLRDDGVYKHVEEKQSCNMEIDYPPLCSKCISLHHRNEPCLESKLTRNKIGDCSFFAHEYEWVDEYGKEICKNCGITGKTKKIDNSSRRCVFCNYKHTKTEPCWNGKIRRY